MRAQKILQTISTLHILTAFYITETKLSIIFNCIFLQKDQDTLIEQSLTLIEQSGKCYNTLIKQSALKPNLICEHNFEHNRLDF